MSHLFCGVLTTVYACLNLEKLLYSVFFFFTAVLYVGIIIYKFGEEICLAYSAVTYYI